MVAWNRRQAPLGATQYEIEAGSAPGLADLATVRVTDPQLVVDGVPTGTYYVRVRAINTIGKSGASREVQVVVP
jgi:predicted phage tail protein